MESNAVFENSRQSVVTEDAVLTRSRYRLRKVVLYCSFPVFFKRFRGISDEVRNLAASTDSPSLHLMGKLHVKRD